MSHRTRFSWAVRARACSPTVRPACRPSWSLSRAPPAHPSRMPTLSRHLPPPPGFQAPTPLPRLRPSPNSGHSQATSGLGRTLGAANLALLGNPRGRRRPRLAPRPALCSPYFLSTSLSSTARPLAARPVAFLSAPVCVPSFNQGELSPEHRGRFCTVTAWLETLQEQARSLQVNRIQKQEQTSSCHSQQSCLLVAAFANPSVRCGSADSAGGRARPWGPRFGGCRVPSPSGSPPASRAPPSGQPHLGTRPRPAP